MIRGALVLLGLVSLAAPCLAGEDWAARTADLPLLHIEVPAPHEVWIRVDPAHAGEARKVMEEVARRYHEAEAPEGDVVVVLWVGGRPLARDAYPKPTSPEANPASPEREGDRS